MFLLFFFQFITNKVYGTWQQNRNTFPNHGRNIRFLSLFLLFRCLYKGAFRLILWHLNANDMSKDVGT